MGQMLYTLNAMTLVLPMCDKRAKSAFILETLCRPAIGHKKRKRKCERGIWRASHWTQHNNGKERILSKVTTFLKQRRRNKRSSWTNVDWGICVWMWRLRHRLCAFERMEYPPRLWNYSGKRLNTKHKEYAASKRLVFAICHGAQWPSLSLSSAFTLCVSRLFAQQPSDVSL